MIRLPLFRRQIPFFFHSLIQTRFFGRPSQKKPSLESRPTHKYWIKLFNLCPRGRKRIDFSFPNFWPFIDKGAVQRESEKNIAHKQHRRWGGKLTMKRLCWWTQKPFAFASNVFSIGYDGVGDKRKPINGAVKKLREPKPVTTIIVYRVSLN